MLSVESLREHCRSKPGSQETFPFDLHTLVFKVAGKMYALCGIDGDPLELSLKCDPDEAEALRSVYPAVKPGYHLKALEHRQVRWHRGRRGGARVARPVL